MSKEIYVLDNNESKDYKYNIEEDTIIYHFSINGSSNVEINLNKENINLYYYYNNINYDDNKLNIKVNHNKEILIVKYIIMELMLKIII
ncbi:MAG: hypothetical protein IJ880_02795 [Bacilli bacterium]|nr:hypothetical protein [Bacilli bacterium]